VLGDAVRAALDPRGKAVRAPAGERPPA
jgi:hypothetical protein